MSRALKARRKIRIKDNYAILRFHREIKMGLLLKKKVCYYCGLNLQHYRELATVDHKRPLSKGGLDARFNIVLSCCDCNQAKGDMTDKEFFEVTK